MKNVVRVIAILAILYFVPKIIQALMFKPAAATAAVANTATAPADTAKPGSNTADALAKSVADENAKLPRSLGAGVTLSHAEFDGHTVRYTYDLDASSGFSPQMKDRFEGNLQHMVCDGAMHYVLTQGYAVLFHTNYPQGGVQQSFDTVFQPGRC